MRRASTEEGRGHPTMELDYTDGQWPRRRAGIEKLALPRRDDGKGASIFGGPLRRRCLFSVILNLDFDIYSLLCYSF